MANQQQFTAIIQGTDSGGAYVDVPFDVEAVFGKKRVQVKVLFDGVPYRGLMVRHGTPNHIIIIRKDIRAQIGKEPGDEVLVVVDEDTAPREVEVPADFQALLDENPTVKAFYEALSYTHRKEYVHWITGAKKEETRLRRMHKAIELLANGQKGR